MKKLLIGLAALTAAVAPAQAARLYGVDEFDNLISYNSAAPGTTLSSVVVQGLNGASILTMDFRVRDGFLYVLTDDFRLLRVNHNTGVSALVNTLAVTGTNFGFDFNPTNANLRIVSNNNTNYVYNFMTNALVQGPNVSYGTAVDPDVTALAYTFNDNNAGTGTTLFGIDTGADALTTINTATGRLTRVGALGVNLGARTSFDITGTGNQTFVQSVNRLYSINLSTGALTLIGNTDRAIFALSAGVPEPATWGMMIIGFGAVGAMSRSARRSRKSQVVSA